MTFKPYTLKEAGFQFEVPESWVVKTSDKDGVKQYILASADETVIMFFAVAEDAGMAEKLWDAYREGIDEEMKNVKSKDHKENKHNGMDHLSESGTGETNGKIMNWSLDILVADKPIVIFGAVEEKSAKKNAEAYSKLLQSMKHTS